MGFFGNTRPYISKEEWLKIRNNLYSVHNFSIIELDRAEDIFRGDMDEDDVNYGIDTKELSKGIQYMKEHTNIHHISLEKITILEAEMMKYL